MANDLYRGRKMYQGPWFFFLLIPVGMVLCFWLFDVSYGFYVEEKLKNDTKTILTKIMDRDSLETIDDYREYAVKLYTEAGYDTKDLSISFEEDYILLINYKEYMSMIGTVSFGLIGNKNDLAVARYKGYYNEYKETVVEEYNEEDEEDLIDEEEDDIIIIQ